MNAILQRECNPVNSMTLEERRALRERRSPASIPRRFGRVMEIRIPVPFLEVRFGVLD